METGRNEKKKITISLSHLCEHICESRICSQTVSEPNVCTIWIEICPQIPHEFILQHIVGLIGKLGTTQGLITIFANFLPICVNI